LGLRSAADKRELLGAADKPLALQLAARQPGKGPEEPALQAAGRQGALADEPDLARQAAGRQGVLADELALALQAAGRGLAAKQLPEWREVA
jgi:hypothetical protein